MAITNNGTKNSLGVSQIPTGYTKPTVTEFSDVEYPRTVVLNVLKATVENASPATTMANIIANATVGINKQVTDLLAADFLATATVTAYAELIGLSTNFATVSGDADFLKNIAASYVCTVKIYVKTA